ncbi:hypothetical protein FHR33_003221 [Nonomuraea dietziae]|uniref:Uncharacterized protein n=1 Tax=Nonomuraea dietziae TaxID=65515 RepID=A0A7W5V3V3_9ACTN|nr:hypothetical protein [Nonomuraea dietziae]
MRPRLGFSDIPTRDTTTSWIVPGTAWPLPSTFVRAGSTRAHPAGNRCRHGRGFGFEAAEITALTKAQFGVGSVFGEQQGERSLS